MRLREFVDEKSEPISDEELNEVENKINFDEFLGYENADNFIFSKSVTNRDSAVLKMCCGIESGEVELTSGTKIYFAFDYGH